MSASATTARFTGKGGGWLVCRPRGLNRGEASCGRCEEPLAAGLWDVGKRKDEGVFGTEAARRRQEGRRDGAARANKRMSSASSPPTYNLVRRASDYEDPKCHLSQGPGAEA